MSQAEATIRGTTEARPRTMAAKIGSVMQSQGALVMLVAVCIMATMRYEAFLTPENLFNVMRQNSMVGLIALGMTFVILTGGIDLSVGSLLALAGVVAAYLLPNGVFVAVVGAVAVTTLLGLVNGILVAKAKIQPFIVTLGMMIAARGLVLAITDEKSVRIKQTFVDFIYLGRGVIGDVLPVPVLILLITFAVGWVVLNYMRFGRHVYALGDNDEAARLLGLNISRTTIGVYAISGALAGLAGVILAARLGAGNPVEGAGIELGAIAAVVVGGTLLTGGQGNVLSTLVGVLLLGVLFNLFNLEGQISPWWQQVLRGVILLVVVVIQNRLTILK